MHRMQSDGWPYSKSSRESLKAPSLHAAVLCAAVFRLKIVRSDRNHYAQCIFHHILQQWTTSSLVCTNSSKNQSMELYDISRF